MLELTRYEHVLVFIGSGTGLQDVFVNSRAKEYHSPVVGTNSDRIRNNLISLVIKMDDSSAFQFEKKVAYFEPLVLWNQ